MADMRAERTRQYLRTALLELLQTKPFEAVTVREVVERAKVSRNSFYNHYSDLIALAEDCYLQLSVYFRGPRKRLRDYTCRIDACTETLTEQAETLEFFRTNQNFARVILDNICTSPYFAECFEAEKDLLLDHLETEYGESDCPWRTNEHLALYITWGMYGHMRNWFISGMRESVETTAKEEVYFALSSTASLMGRPIEPEYLQAIEQWTWPKKNETATAGGSN